MSFAACSFLFRVIFRDSFRHGFAYENCNDAHVLLYIAFSCSHTVLVESLDSFFLCFFFLFGFKRFRSFCMNSTPFLKDVQTNERARKRKTKWKIYNKMNWRQLFASRMSDKVFFISHTPYMHTKEKRKLFIWDEPNVYTFTFRKSHESSFKQRKWAPVKNNNKNIETFSLVISY